MHPKLIALPGNMRFIVLGVVLLIWLLVRVGQFFITSRKSGASLPLGAQRDYGLAGGAVCPRCHRPIRLGLMSIKLGIGTKLVRCEFCGKWSVVRRLSMEELHAAEAAELAEAQPAEPIQEKSAEEKMKDLLEQSRYTDRP